jgi:hypothetical protein
MANHNQNPPVTVFAGDIVKHNTLINDIIDHWKVFGTSQL